MPETFASARAERQEVRTTLPFILTLALSAPALAGQEPIITTVAGGGPNEVAALSANLASPKGLALDAAGNLFIADRTQQRIFKVNPSGRLAVAAGDGSALHEIICVTTPCPTFAYSTPTSLNSPWGVAVDGAGALLVADSYSNRIRRVDPATGEITTVAGTGLYGFDGDGGPATQASLARPIGLLLDGAGNLFIADLDNSRVRRVDAAGNITTVAGNGIQRASGDGGPAVDASVYPTALALDPAGNLLIADGGNSSVRRVDAATGIITTVAGGNGDGFSGDGGPAVNAQLRWPSGISLDAAGNLLIADTGNQRIRRVDRETGVIVTIAGDGIARFAGDNGPAILASLNQPTGLATNSRGDLYISDGSNFRVRRLDAATGFIVTVAGNGSNYFSGDEGPARNARLTYPAHVVVDVSGNLFIGDAGRIRRVDSHTGVVVTIAGNGSTEFGGDGGPAIEAGFSGPGGMALDAAGNLFFADRWNQRVRRVDAITGIITTVAGNGEFGFSGDGGPARQARLSNPTSVAVDRRGNLLIAEDSFVARIRRVDSATGTITTVAGNDGFMGGDGIPAVDARLSGITDVEVDEAGNFFFTEAGLGRIHRVDGTTGILTTVAGGGYWGSSLGDGGPATQAGLRNPTGIALDGAGNLFIADNDNLRVRRVDAVTGVITTLAGQGTVGFAGDGGPATGAALNHPQDVATDALGNVFIADSDNFRIRRVSLANRPPVANAGAGAQLECTSAAGVRVRLDGSHSSDPDSSAGTQDDIVAFEWFENLGGPGETLLGSGESLDPILPLGTHPITLRVTDRAGLTATDVVEISVVDTVAPQMTLRLSPSILSPPNHLMVPIRASAQVGDACGTPAVTLVSVISSEPDDAPGAGDGNTAQDIQGAEEGTADFDFLVRAERCGRGPGRTYTVTYRVTDASGNSTMARAVVTVP
jgi:sugar lactone lactonase YvrE